MGNRLTENNTGVISYTYDSNNKLTQLVGPSGTTTFGYDNNGNTTSMVQPGPVTTTYGYNYENRMTSVANPSYTANYAYAADGLRLRVQESNNANPDRWMQYDGVRPVLEGTLSGNTFTTLNKYVWEGDSYYDPLVFAYLGGAWAYHLYDGLGSTRQLLDSSQTVTDTYQYEAFGNLMASSGATPNPYRYVGEMGYYQTGSSLMQVGVRYLSPELGRFSQNDPAIRLTRYAYVKNNPVIGLDPTGLMRLGGGEPPEPSKTGEYCDAWKDWCKQTTGFPVVKQCVRDALAALGLGSGIIAMTACIAGCLFFSGQGPFLCGIECGLGLAVLSVVTALGPCSAASHQAMRACNDGYQVCCEWVGGRRGRR